MSRDNPSKQFPLQFAIIRFDGRVREGKEKDCYHCNFSISDGVIGLVPKLLLFPMEGREEERKKERSE